MVQGFLGSTHPCLSFREIWFSCHKGNVGRCWHHSRHCESALEEAGQRQGFSTFSSQSTTWKYGLIVWWLFGHALILCNIRIICIDMTNRVILYAVHMLCLHWFGPNSTCKLTGSAMVCAASRTDSAFVLLWGRRLDLQIALKIASSRNTYWLLHPTDPTCEKSDIFYIGCSLESLQSLQDIWKKPCIGHTEARSMFWRRPTRAKGYVSMALGQGQKHSQMQVQHSETLKCEMTCRCLFHASSFPIINSDISAFLRKDHLVKTPPCCCEVEEAALLLEELLEEGYQCMSLNYVAKHTYTYVKCCWISPTMKLISGGSKFK